MRVELEIVQNGWLEVRWFDLVEPPDEEQEPGEQNVRTEWYHQLQRSKLEADAAEMGTNLDTLFLDNWQNTYTPAEETSDNRWARIKAIRDEITQRGGHKVGAHWFHSDTFSRTQQMGLVMLGANIPSNLKWKTMSGVFVDMTPVLAQQIFAAAAAKDSAVFAHAEYLKATPTANIFEGWPESFTPGS